MPSHKAIFFAQNGPWPHACYFCGELVEAPVSGTQSAVIHHVNGDRSDNSLPNLVAAHNRCHQSHHHKGRKRSQATREKLRASHLGKKLSPEQVAKIAAANRGRKQSPEWVAKRIASRADWVPSEETRAKIAETLRRRYREMGEEERETYRAIRKKYAARGVQHSETLKKAWEDPEKRARMVAAQKAAYPPAPCPRCGRIIKGKQQMAKHLRACRA